MLKWFRRLFLLATFSLLIISNLLTITSAAFNTALSGLVTSTLGLQTATSTLRRNLSNQRAHNQSLQRKLTTQKQAVMHHGQRNINRTKRMARFKFAELSVTALPIIGGVVLAGGLIWELSQLCNGIRDLEGLYVELEIDSEIDAMAYTRVCQAPQWIDALGN